MQGLLAVILMLTQPLSAEGGELLDVGLWLQRPGVRFLAVEFYASWCAPCKATVPLWKELHDKYRDQGLRLVVVALRDPGGSCANPGWSPDEVVCDLDGKVGKRWGLGDHLPAAFLWSWRGKLLVGNGHIKEVQDALEREISRAPRITVDDHMDPVLRELLRAELGRVGKIDVVAGKREQEALTEIRRQSHQLQFREDSICKLGVRLAPNTLLKASVVETVSGSRLLVYLFSAETGCLTASAGVIWDEEQPELSVQGAVAGLMEQLVVSTVMPEQRLETPEPITDPWFNLGVSLAEGVLKAGSSLERTSVTAFGSIWLRSGRIRWEAISVGGGLEGQGGLFLGTGLAWDAIAGLYLHAAGRLLIADGASYWGALAGLGYGFRLSPSWTLDMEFDASVWPGEVVVLPLEARVGVRYGF